MENDQVALWSKRYLLFMRAEKNASPHTLRAYEKDLKDFSCFLTQSPLDLSTFRKSRLLVREYWQSLAQRKIRPVTIARKLASLSSFFKYLIRENQMESNPFDYLPPLKKEKTLPHFLSEKEMDLILSQLEHLKGKLSLRNRALVELLYTSGLRIQETVELNVEDIDFWNALVKVLGKGSKERIVPVGKIAIQAIESYLSERQKKTGREAHGALFLNARGGRLTTDGIRKILKTIARQVQIPKRLNPHVFRHTFATHLLNNGCDLRVVQEMLGHKNLTTTEKYTHTTLEHLKKVYDKAHPRA